MSCLKRSQAMRCILWLPLFPKDLPRYEMSRVLTKYSHLIAVNKRKLAFGSNASSQRIRTCPYEELELSFRANKQFYLRCIGRTADSLDSERTKTVDVRLVQNNPILLYSTSGLPDEFTAVSDVNALLHGTRTDGRRAESSFAIS